MGKLHTTVHETKSVIKSYKLSNGGFVELELDESDAGYLKVHVGSSESMFDSMQAWRWIQHADDKKNIETLTEIRDACNAILESL